MSRLKAIAASMSLVVFLVSLVMAVTPAKAWGEFVRQWTQGMNTVCLAREAATTKSVNQIPLKKDN